MKFMWSTINKIKENLHNCLIVLTGYHSMRKPNESLEKSKTDIVILSNHVDFVLKELIDELKKKENLNDIDDLNQWNNFKKKNGEITKNYNFKKIEKISSSG